MKIVHLILLGLVAWFSLAAPSAILAQTPPGIVPASADPATGTPPKPADPFRLNIGLEGGSGQTGQVGVALQIVIVMTLLSVAPSIVLLMTCFTRIVIVLGFVRTALGTPSALKQTRTRELEYFLELGGFGPTAVKDLPLRVVIPAFVISELQTAFQMGFLLFLPFLVIDFLVSSVLMALGMMMMPPTTVALPLKLLLFVLVDGWHLVVKSLVQSFA
jgi:flagellar biosynthetic protein FliP